MDFEFETTRTGLANAFAAAGAELMSYMGTTGALAPIHDTNPQQYVVAGTLHMIGKLLPVQDAAEKPTGYLTDEQIIEICAKEGLGPCLGLAVGRAIERAAIAAHLARHPQAERRINDGPKVASAIASINRGEDDEGSETPVIYTHEEVAEMLTYELVTDSGARTLLNGDSMEFNLTELALLANRAAHLGRQSQQAEQKGNHDSLNSDAGEGKEADLSGKYVKIDDVRELLARRAEPSVAADERAMFEAWIRARPGYPFAGAFTNLMWDAWQARAALASPAVSQKDGSAVEYDKIVKADERALRAVDALDGMGFAYDEEIGWLPSAATTAGAYFPNECSATGQTCSYGPNGINGERQCRYCGAKPEDTTASASKWDAVPPEFNTWWNAETDTPSNPFAAGTPAFWAWEGWKAGRATAPSRDAAESTSDTDEPYFDPEYGLRQKLAQILDHIGPDDEWRHPIAEALSIISAQGERG